MIQCGDGPSAAVGGCNGAKAHAGAGVHDRREMSWRDDAKQEGRHYQACVEQSMLSNHGVPLYARRLASRPFMVRDEA